MSAPLKKRALQKEEENSESESSEDEFQNEFVSNEEIQVEFEGRNPIDSDFHGIKQLLNQLFLKAQINLSDLVDLIIKQNYVGSVITTSESCNEDSEEEDDDSSENIIYGITTMLNITEKKNIECIKQLRLLLLEWAKQHATDQLNNIIQSILENDSRHVGFLINERFINIPTKITLPLYDHLIKEIDRAANKKMAFKFDYIIMICKLYKMDEKIDRKKNQKNHPSVIWSNPEDEIINEVAEFTYEFSVKDKYDCGIGGHWSNDDVTMIPYRRILLIPINKFKEILEQLKHSIT